MFLHLYSDLHTVKIHTEIEVQIWRRLQWVLDIFAAWLLGVGPDWNISKTTILCKYSWCPGDESYRPWTLVAPPVGQSFNLSIYKTDNYKNGTDIHGLQNSTDFGDPLTFLLHHLEVDIMTLSEVFQQLWDVWPWKSATFSSEQFADSQISQSSHHQVKI